MRKLIVAAAAIALTAWFNPTTTTTHAAPPACDAKMGTDNIALGAKLYLIHSIGWPEHNRTNNTWTVSDADPYNDFICWTPASWHPWLTVMCEQLSYNAEELFPTLVTRIKLGQSR